MTDIELIREALYEVLSPDWELDSEAYRHAAEAVVSVLAGRLLPEPVETRCRNCDHLVSTHGAGGVLVHGLEGADRREPGVHLRLD